MKIMGASAFQLHPFRADLRPLKSRRYFRQSHFSASGKSEPPWFELCP
jgi:hypothetical protein